MNAFHNKTPLLIFLLINPLPLLSMKKDILNPTAPQPAATVKYAKESEMIAYANKNLTKAKNKLEIAQQEAQILSYVKNPQKYWTDEEQESAINAHAQFTLDEQIKKLQRRNS